MTFPGNRNSSIMTLSLKLGWKIAIEGPHWSTAHSATSYCMLPPIGSATYFHMMEEAQGPFTPSKLGRHCGAPQGRIGAEGM